jgi:hypothetical protein
MESGGNAMKKTLIRRLMNPALKVGLCCVAGSLFLAATPLQAQSAPQRDGKQLKLVLARQSTADPVEIMKHLSQKCPNITLTTNPRNSDYLLYAGGWSGGYRFMVIAKGGATIFATRTALLSNAVKDVCKFLDARP